MVKYIVDLANSLFAPGQVNIPFIPPIHTANTDSLSCSTSVSALIAVSPNQVVRFSNAGSTAISIGFGTNTGGNNLSGLTNAHGIDIMPGAVEAFTVPVGATHFAAIMASGTGTLKYAIGVGG